MNLWFVIYWLSVNVLNCILQLTLFDHITTYKHKDTPVAVNKDYGHHVHRAWVDTHSQGIRTDPEIYLPGEVTAKDGHSAEDAHGDNDAGNDEGGLADVTSGVKRKAESNNRSGLTRKVAKTTAKGGPSTAAREVIDDRWPDLTLIDVPVGENILAHPYGRQSCLYIEMKVALDDKPNPQGAVSRLFLGFLYY